MLRVVVLQFIASIVVASGAWMVAGHRAAVSSLLGGLACAVANGLFALNLAQVGLSAGARADGHENDGRSRSAGAATHRTYAGYAAALLVGEFVKVVLTIGLLALVAWAYKDVVWLALIVAVIAVLFMQAAALAWR